MQIRPRPQTTEKNIQLFVHNLKGRCLTFSLPHGCSVKQLKELVESREGVPSEGIVLCTAGKSLDNNFEIGESFNNATLTLALRPLPPDRELHKIAETANALRAGVLGKPSAFESILSQLVPKIRKEVSLEASLSSHILNTILERLGYEHRSVEPSWFSLARNLVAALPAPRPSNKVFSFLVQHGAWTQLARFFQSLRPRDYNARDLSHFESFTLFVDTLIGTYIRPRPYCSLPSVYDFIYLITPLLSPGHGHVLCGILTKQFVINIRTLLLIKDSPMLEHSDCITDFMTRLILLPNKMEDPDLRQAIKSALNNALTVKDALDLKMSNGLEQQLAITIIRFLLDSCVAYLDPIAVSKFFLLSPAGYRIAPATKRLVEMLREGRGNSAYSDLLGSIVHLYKAISFHPKLPLTCELRHYSLTDLCIYSLVKSKKQEELAKLPQDLQCRAIALMLQTGLFEKDSVKAMVSSNLKILDLSKLNYDEPAVSRIIDLGLQLREISLADQDTFTGAAFCNQSFTNLTSLTLTNCRAFTDAALQSVLLTSPLRTLFIDTCSEITDEGYMAISSVTSLRELGVIDTKNCSNHTLLLITGLKHLELLTLRRIPALDSEVTFKILTELHYLRALDLSGNKRLTYDAFVCAGALPSLESLVLSGCRFEGEGLYQIMKNYPNLLELRLRKIKGVDFKEMLAGVEECTLQSIDISSCTVSGIGHLFSLAAKSLRYVKLEGTEFTEKFNVSEMPVLPALTHLNCATLEWSGELGSTLGLKTLISKIPSVEVLVLKNILAPITNKEQLSLLFHSLPNLQKLDLESMRIEPDLLEVVASSLKQPLKLRYTRPISTLELMALSAAAPFLTIVDGSDGSWRAIQSLTEECANCSHASTDEAKIQEKLAYFRADRSVEKPLVLKDANDAIGLSSDEEEEEELVLEDDELFQAQDLELTSLELQQMSDNVLLGSVLDL